MSELTLNEQYAVTCKGWICNENKLTYKWEHTNLNPVGQLPNYLSDDAELGRMVKALGKADPREFIQYWCGEGSEQWALDVSELLPRKENMFYAMSAHEVFMRACIALKLQVPS